MKQFAVRLAVNAPTTGAFTRLSIFVALALAWSIPADAQPPAIELRAVQPLATSIGTSVDLRTITANGLDQVDRLIFAHPGITATLKTTAPLPFDETPQPQFGHFTVTIASDVPPGIYEVRACGRFGISNPRFLMVFPLATEWISSDHHSSETAKQLDADRVLSTNFRPQQRNQYRLHVEAGELVQLGCWSTSIDSRSLPNLIVKNAMGRELARSRAIGTSAVWLECQATQSEDWTLVVHDFLYRGGDDQGYALARFRSQADSPISPWRTLNPFLAPSSIGLSRWMDGKIPALQHAESLEDSTAPNPTRDPVPLPSIVQGRFDQEHDVDGIEFDASPGQAVQAVVFSQSIHQWTDVRMILERIERTADGQEKVERIAVEEDQPMIGQPAMSLGSRDPRGNWTLQAGGRYRLSLTNLQTGVSDSVFTNYSLILSSPRPDFDAVAYFPNPTNNPAQSRPIGSHLSRGGTANVRVVVRRSAGFEGPIVLSVDPLPPGVRCTPVYLAAGQNETELMLIAAEDAAAWQGPLNVVATATIDQQSVQRIVQPSTIALPASAERGLPMARLTDQLWLSISDQDLAPLSIQVGDGNPLQIARGSKAPIPIKLIRRAGGGDKVVLRPQYLPPKVGLGEIPIETNASEAAPEIQIAADTPNGDYTVWFQAETKLKFSVNAQALQRAQQYRSKLQMILEDPNRAAEKPEVEKAITAADAQIEQLKKETAERESPWFLPSASLHVRVVDPAPG